LKNESRLPLDATKQLESVNIKL